MFVPVCAYVCLDGSAYRHVYVGLCSCAYERETERGSIGWSDCNTYFGRSLCVFMFEMVIPVCANQCLGGCAYMHVCVHVSLCACSWQRGRGEGLVNGNVRNMLVGLCVCVCLNMFVNVHAYECLGGCAYIHVCGCVALCIFWQ